MPAGRDTPAGPGPSHRAGKDTVEITEYLEEQAPQPPRRNEYNEDNTDVGLSSMCSPSGSENIKDKLGLSCARLSSGWLQAFLLLIKR